LTPPYAGLSALNPQFFVEKNREKWLSDGMQKILKLHASNPTSKILKKLDWERG